MRAYPAGPGSIGWPGRYICGGLFPAGCPPWVLVDLGSKNGTRVNGWRADSGFTVHAGDWVSFGAAAFRLADPA